MNNEYEYFRPHRIRDNSIPLLVQGGNSPDYLYTRSFVEDPKLMSFALRDPIPRKPKMADYLPSPNTVVSKKIFDVLNLLNIEGIQLLPAIIYGKNDEIYSDYWGLHIFNRIQCVDFSASNCTHDDISFDMVEKIVLNKEVLKKIPLKQRLIFRLKEDRGFQLFHDSVVQQILNVKPSGIRFTNIEKWHDGSYFED